MMLALLGAAWAASPAEKAQMAELDRVRGTIANEVQLAAYDLVDELVYGWVADPVFAAPTPVVLAGVTVPVGLGTGMEALLEDHIASVLAKNPTTHIQLVYCPACNEVVVHSGPEATVVSRGIDDPAVLAEVGGGATGKHALFVDIEAEGTFLVLRARLTELSPDLPIVWSHTISTSSSTPALLRQEDDLKSADEARKEYLDALHDRGPIAVPLRLAVRSYGASDGNTVSAPPFLWLESGVELSVNDAAAWTSSFLVGYSFIPQAYQGLMAQGRISRLVTGVARSHTRPDLYGFVGAAAITVWGPATAPFTNDEVTADQILAGADAEGPRSTFGALQLGIDLRIGNRIGVSSFLETMPEFAKSPNLGDHVHVLGVGFQSLGTEVTLWF